MNEAAIKKIARGAGLNMGRFAKDRTSKRTLQRLQEDEDLAERWGAKGTPATWINGRPLQGAYPFSHVSELVRQAL